MSAQPNSEIDEFVETSEGGLRRIALAVPDAYCAACIQTIEGTLQATPGVHLARVNLGRRRVQVEFDEAIEPEAVSAAIARSGYRNHPIDPSEADGRDPVLRELVAGLVVSGFATAHTMFFSEAVWAGLGGDARTLFHWLSAIVAVPAVAYAGQSFFRSAWAALRVGRLNMDVPIALALVATTGLSLLEARLGEEHAYFDASTMLLFFLLIGRTLDHLMRGQARDAAANLARIAPRGARRVLDDGSAQFVKTADIRPGMKLLLRPGDRSPVDCSVAMAEHGSVDLSVVNGESMPVEVRERSELPAGTLVLDRPLQVVAARISSDSFLARTSQLMEAAETTRTRYRRIADRASDLYAPLIHIVSVITFVLWMALGAGWHTALVNAVAVLIVTCPCALALAVPMVHVVAAGRLFSAGILMKDGAALERLASTKTVVFDKTGTLTTGRPLLEAQVKGSPNMLSIAGALAAASNHPLSIAISAASPALAPPDVREIAGSGVEASIAGHIWRLGNARFCSAEDDGEGLTRVWLSRDNEVVAAFVFSEQNRPDAKEAVSALKADGVEVALLSGDRRGRTEKIAEELGIEDARGERTPADKQAAISVWRLKGGVAMVGDGINDAIALRAADVSFAPAAAVDVGRAAADFVLTNDKLIGVPFSIVVARNADKLVRQNLVISIAYNLVVMPLAVAGLVTPLIAAIAMSSSSLIVVLNAMRLRLMRQASRSRSAR